MLPNLYRDHFSSREWVDSKPFKKERERLGWEPACRDTSVIERNQGFSTVINSTLAETAYVAWLQQTVAQRESTLWRSTGSSCWQRCWILLTWHDSWACSEPFPKKPGYIYLVRTCFTQKPKERWHFVQKVRRQQRRNIQKQTTCIEMHRSVRA